MQLNRKQIIIEKDFQLRMIGYLLSALAIISLIYFLGFLYFINNLEKLGISIGLTEGHPYFAFLKTQMNRLMIIFSVTTLISLIVFVIFGLFVTHRIAGPIVKLTQYFDRQAAGESPEPVQFRKKDFFKDLASAINRFQEKRGKG